MIEEMTSLALRLSSLYMSGPFEKTVNHDQVVEVVELKKICPEPSPKVDPEIPLEPMAALGLLWSVLHTPGRLQQSLPSVLTFLARVRLVLPYSCTSLYPRESHE